MFLGAIFETPSHPNVRGIGIDEFAQVTLACPGPVIGIGGINPRRARSVVKAGASGVAVLRGALAVLAERGRARRCEYVAAAAHALGDLRAFSIGVLVAGSIVGRPAPHLGSDGVLKSGREAERSATCRPSGNVSFGTNTMRPRRTISRRG